MLVKNVRSCAQLAVTDTARCVLRLTAMTAVIAVCLLRGRHLCRLLQSTQMHHRTALKDQRRPQLPLVLLLAPPLSSRLVRHRRQHVLPV